MRAFPPAPVFGVPGTDEPVPSPRATGPGDAPSTWPGGVPPAPDPTIGPLPPPPPPPPLLPPPPPPPPEVPPVTVPEIVPEGSVLPLSVPVTIEPVPTVPEIVPVVPPEPPESVPVTIEALATDAPAVSAANIAALTIRFLMF